MILSELAKLFFKGQGWQYEVTPGVLDEPKNVIIGFPHTTNMDTVRAVTLFFILKHPFHVLVKKELFKFPLDVVFNRLGFIPVDRQKSSNVVQDMARRFAESSHFSLVIAPEATRDKLGQKRPIRTGFWHIAKAANVPVVFMLADNNARTGRVFGKLYPGEDMHADLEKIRDAYARYGIEVNLPAPAAA